MRTAILIQGAISGLLLGLAACPGGSGGDECMLGEEGCACNAGQCLPGLICLSNLCVEEPGSLTTGNPDSETGPDVKPDLGGNTGDGDGDGDPACAFNSDCAPSEACVDGTCLDTDFLYFDVLVDYFLPIAARCDDGLGDGTVELFYRAYMSEALQLTSSVEDCPAEWTESWVYDSLQAFRIEFWEEDISFDDLILNLCWQNANAECVPIPKQTLHDGFYASDINGHYLEMSFYPRLSP